MQNAMLSPTAKRARLDDGSGPTTTLALLGLSEELQEAILTHCDAASLGLLEQV